MNLNLTLLKNASQILTMCDSSLGIVSDSGILFNDKIIAIEKEEELESIVNSKYPDFPVAVLDAGGGVVMPGFVDSHTHLIFAGSRENEFRMRLEGKKYLEILEAGGGIISTVRATREASSELLLELGRRRLDTMLRYGTTTVEAKSGYGLDLETEIKILRVIKHLDEIHPADVIPTFMGAHAIPPEYRGRKEEYLNFLIKRVLPEVAEAGLAVFCDIFCEKGVFEVDETRHYLEKAAESGFMLKMHADEIHDLGGAVLAGELSAVSADHLGAVGDNGISALKESGTVATLLPTTLFYLMSRTYAPARKLLNEGVTVAIASDFNPGSSFGESMQMAVTAALLNMQMTPEEVLRAATRNGAKALRLEDRGELATGKLADMLILDAPNYLYFAHHFGVNQVKCTIKRGQQYWN
ncbi:MAG: imidazolonepropionase [Candidatus Wallbacteria bacterium]|nr:imidazolonepropionase [Candidatus Wallbacteria bacterium]